MDSNVALALRHEAEGVAWYTFPTLVDPSTVLAAVSARHGGVSEGELASLNLGFAVGDEPERVRENHRRLFAALAVDPGRAVSVAQVHGARVLEVDAAAGGSDPARFLGPADGLVTDRPGLALCLRFADCVPLLAWDRRHGVVGAAHAGWRGTLAGIASELVGTMLRRGGSLADLKVVVGPSIGPCCYVVGPELAASFDQRWGHLGLTAHRDRIASGSSDPARRTPLSRADRGAGWRLDLGELNRRQLIDAGVPAESVVLTGPCTACRADEFFSHRGQGGRAGRFGAVVALR